MTRFLICFPLALIAAAECIPLTGDKILVRDLAKAVPEFSAAPAEAVLSFAPIPGLTRNFRANEIVMFSRRFQTPLAAGSAKDVCFQSTAAVLTEDQIRAAILPAIPFHVVSLKIVDFSRMPVPPGKLEFPPAGVSQWSTNPPGTTVWQGRVLMDSGHSFPVWVKLSIVVEAKIVASARALQKDQRLTAEDVTYLSEASFPLPEGVLSSVESAIGKVALRAVSPGRPMVAALLGRPQEVAPGDVVDVESFCGEAHLHFKGRALMSGRQGDLISVLNPNGRSFRARVTDKDRVEVRSSFGE